MAHRRGIGNAELRAEFMVTERWITDLKIRLADPVGTTYPDDGLPRETPDGGAAAIAELERLEAGGTAIVAGWALGWATDFSYYELAGDGSVTPHVFIASDVATYGKRIF